MHKVWSKGDLCMSPFSGDNKLYKGIIQKILRSPEGQIFAKVKFDGYDEGDSEEVEVTKLKEISVTETVKVSSVQKKDTSVARTYGGMFHPLQGNELCQRLKARYDSDDEDDEISVKSEKLSAVLFGNSPTCTQQGKQTVQTPSTSKENGTRLTGKRARKGTNKGFIALHSPSPRSRRTTLNITGGQAKDQSKELFTSKKLSDISSIVDSRVVTKALQDQTPTFTAHSSEDNDEEMTSAGFTDEDLEKPKFSFKPDGAKVPYVLSRDGEVPLIQVPGTLNQYLRDYQREGIKFLYDHYREDTGAILGDDMGLGKTVQVIGFLSALLGKQGDRVDVMRQKPKFIRKLSDSASVRNDPPTKGPFLIIGPGCVLYNWLEELETWGYFIVRKFHGSDKAECLKDIRKGKVEIVVTTFETYREHMASLNTINWDAVIVDEVHKIKDLKARTTKALRSMPTIRRFGLTGTALQNNLMEFWSILDWAKPGCLGSQSDFDHEFVRPIEEGQRHDANKRELASARKQKDKLSEIRKTMMIRRVKSLIADQLPKKDDNVVFCKLSQLQVSIYQTILKHPGMDLVIHGDDPCGCDSGESQSKCCKQKTPDGHSVKSLRFTFMHLLLKTSNHVALLIPTEKTSKNQAKLSSQICEVALKDHPEFVTQTKEASFKTLSDPKYCGKMKILQGLLKVFYKEHAKVLVFSYSTQVLDIIEQHLMSTGYEFRRIDGNVSAKKRIGVVREFNTDPNIFICLISTKAGGLGLNLTGANKVVIFDPNWNPTHDLQAQDRAYRIGQRRNVHVYRLVSSGTIEENMYLRQIYKQQLLNVTVEDENARRYFYAVQGNPRMKGEIFGIKNMFTLRTGESCITRDIIKRNERIESGLAGFETARYVPPVVRVEEDEHYDDTIHNEHTTDDDSEDLFAQFFSSEETLEENEEALGENKDTSDEEEEKEAFHQGQGLDRGDHSTCPNKGHIDVSNNEENEKNASTSNAAVGSKRRQVLLAEPSRGKIRPSQSKTGKGPLRHRKRNNDVVPQYDQTLAGTFSNVSDVFDNCGVVHIHENVKVVGGSRAEDHMTKCAISDVYELHQHSQELAVQCEPMQQPIEEEQVASAVQRRTRQPSVEDRNSPRSAVISRSKVLIGQTPKAIRLKHVQEMADIHTAGSLLDFAVLVLGSSLEERICLLNSLYESKEPALKNIHKLQPIREEIPGGSRKRERTCSTELSESRILERKKRSSSVMKSRSRNRPKDGVIGKSKVLSIKGSDLHSSKTSPNAEMNPQSSKEMGHSRTRAPAESSMKEDRRLSQRKRAPLANVKSSETHDQAPSENLNHNTDTGTRDKKRESKNDGNNTQDLLDEIGKASEENGGSVVDGDTDLNMKTKVSNVTSVLDMFDELVYTSEHKRRPPPPRKLSRNCPVKRTNGVCETYEIPTKIKKSVAHRDKLKEEVDNPCKIIDEIFGNNAVRNGQNESSEGKTEVRKIGVDSPESETEINLDESTLKEGYFEDFDNPRLWKKIKKKEPDKRSLVDRLIADSDADFNDLFTAGILKKKCSERNMQKIGGASESSSECDASASLF